MAGRLVVVVRAVAANTWALSGVGLSPAEAAARVDELSARNPAARIAVLQVVRSFRPTVTREEDQTPSVDE